MSIKETWVKVPDKWKYEIRSIIHTFIAAALAEWALSGGGVPTSKEAIYALVFAMVRAGVKAISMRFLPAEKKEV